MHLVKFCLHGDAITCNSVSISDRRALDIADYLRFSDWSYKYHELAWRPGNETQLLELGKSIHLWLDGEEHWLHALRQANGGAVIATFTVPNQTDEHARLFLEVPWELAADEEGHLTADPTVKWAPVRRIGTPVAPLPPNDRYRLGMMFTAAAPLRTAELDFEAEEIAILHSTERTGLDLFVEDTGSLGELRTSWQEKESLDVLHVSCHGVGGFNPGLAMEGADGKLELVGVEELAEAFADRLPRLLFLSACHTGRNNATVDSLARSLVGAGFPAVLAWADEVKDAEATAFAASFYGEASQPATSIEFAWAEARHNLLHPASGKQPAAHWHMARLYLSPTGGGSLATGRRARLPSGPDAGRKGIVSARGQQLEVASRFEFVGRRREIQVIEGEFRQPKHAGVLIHGLGRQGKSSLAARIIDRHPHLASVVLFRRCDGPSLLAEIRHRVFPASEICGRYARRVDPNLAEYDPEALYDALRALFKGPCSGAGTGKPILLVLDDFEALLTAPIGTMPWRIREEAADALSAIIRAFDHRDTDSRLLITSRYAFRLDEGGGSTPRLLEISLPAMSPVNRIKQARQKLLALDRGDGSAILGPSAHLAPLIRRLIAAARGNAGLQDLLLKSAVADPAAGEAAVRALEDYLAGDRLPEQEELRAILENLLIDNLIQHLTDEERVLLRNSTLFKLPVPLTVWESYAHRFAPGRITRLIEFGLWERLPDVFEPRIDAACLSQIARGRLSVPEDHDARLAMTAVLDDLFSVWGGEDRSRSSSPVDIELTRLALSTGNARVLAATAERAIRGLGELSDFPAAAATAIGVLDALVVTGRTPTLHLLRAAAEVFERVGDAEGLRRVFANASNLGSDETSQPSEVRLARAQFRLRYGNYLRQLGQQDAALHELKTAQSVFQSLADRRWHAAALGSIAVILQDKGDLDTALQLFNEELRSFVILGQRQDQAATLSDIAQIMTRKGDVEAALKIHEELLQIVEVFGDRRGRAVTLGNIGRIRRAKGQLDIALALHREQVAILESLSDRRTRAVALGDIAAIVQEKGQIDVALALHRERLEVFEMLGDLREREVTLTDIAEILEAKGDIDGALKCRQDRLQDLKALGDQRRLGRALQDVAEMKSRNGDFAGALALHQERAEVVMSMEDLHGRATVINDLARNMTKTGQSNAALSVHREALKIFEQLEDRRGRAIVLGDIARIMRAKGDVDEAFRSHQEQLQIFEELGDRRSWAVILGDIAEILRARGEVDEALKLQKERLEVNRQLADQDGIAAASAAIGQMYLDRARKKRDAQSFHLAREALTESYRIVLAIGPLEGVAFVGKDLGEVLIEAGEYNQAREFFQRSGDAFLRLGYIKQVADIEELLQKF